MKTVAFRPRRSSEKEFELRLRISKSGTEHYNQRVMGTRTRLLHKITGVLTVLIFLGTGAYMRVNGPELFQSDPTLRMMFRSNHIYILMAGLINIGIGSYLVLSRQRSRRILQLIGSSFLLVAPVLLVCAFFSEPSGKRFERHLTLSAMILLLTGTVFHLLSTARSSRDIERSNGDVQEHRLDRAVGASEYGRGK